MKIMKPIKLIIFVLALSGNECHFGIIKETSDHDESLERLAESAVSTMLSCFDVNAVGAVGITEPKLRKLLMSNDSRQVILFSNNLARDLGSIQPVDLKTPHKILLFVVETSSQPVQVIPQLLGRAVTSQPSSSTTTYLIIDWPSQKNKNNCSNAPDNLFTAYRWSMMNALYVCLDKVKEKMLVYSYNPYTSRAPAPWQLDATFKGLNGHHWSLFVREYRPGNPNSCSNLNFVKTHDLGGYYVRCYVQTPVRSSEKTIIERKQIAEAAFNRKTNQYLHEILKALNATPDLFMRMMYSDKEEFWSCRLNMTFKHFTQFFDINAAVSNDLDSTDKETTSHILRDGLAVVTQHKGELSQLDKLIGVLDKSTRIGLFLVAFKTLLFFKYFMRQHLGTAVLNVCRIVTNMGLVKVPNRVAPRLYLAGVFILVVTIVGIYQGLIASLLTKPTPLPEINTMEDLMDSPHTIYMINRIVPHFTDPKFKGRIVIVDSVPDCIEYVVRDPMAACVTLRINLLRNTINLNLHVSTDVIVPMYLLYEIQTNWRFKNRVNEIIELFTQSHIAWYIYERELEYALEHREYNRNLERDRPKTMKLSDLGFAFAILGIGYGLATVAFIVEIAMKRA